MFLRSQGATESVTEYVAQLRKLATHCEIGEFLSEALRDRLVCGLVSAITQKRLLSEANLTLAKAVEIAQGMEAAERRAKIFHGEEGVSIGRIQSAGRPKGEQTHGGSPFSRCGGSGHHSGVCRFRTAVCHTCKKKGHLARVCRSGKKQQTKLPPPKRQLVVGTRGEEDGEESPEDDEDYSIFHVGDKS